MSVPDELVTAAAAAVCMERPLGQACPECLVEASIALAAAFAKLAECEEAVMFVAEQMPHGWRDDDGVAHDEVSRGNYNQAKAYLAALAKWGQP